MEEKIVITAFQNLEKITGIKGNWENIAPFYVDKGYDIKVKIKFKKRTITLYGILKKEIREHQVFNILEQLNLNRNVILIAENIFPKIREKLRELEIGYLDINGNMFYTDNTNYVFIETQQKKQTTVKKNRVFTKIGLKVLFTILTEPELINAPYRVIATKADVALGTVNNFIKGLKELGYIIEIDKNYKKIQNINDLMEKWTNEYNHTLKPDLHIGNYRFLNEQDYNNWKNLDFKTNNTCWGGEPAADLITNYLKPGEFIIYTEERPNELMRNYKLIPDEEGYIKVYKKFWKNNVQNNYAPELLVYADLINTGNDRNLETAKLIYEKFGNYR